MAAPRFEAAIVGVREAVKTSQGLTVPVAAASRRVIPDWAVVPALGFKMPGPLPAALARSDVSDAVKTLRWWADRGAMTAAACPLFRQRYPKVRLDE